MGKISIIQATQRKRYGSSRINKPTDGADGVFTPAHVCFPPLLDPSVAVNWNAG